MVPLGVFSFARQLLNYLKKNLAFFSFVQSTLRTILKAICYVMPTNFLSIFEIKHARKAENWNFKKYFLGGGANMIITL